MTSSCKGSQETVKARPGVTDKNWAYIVGLFSCSSSQADRLIVLCKGDARTARQSAFFDMVNLGRLWQVCMLPIGTQEQNILGVDEKEVKPVFGKGLVRLAPMSQGACPHVTAMYRKKGQRSRPKQVGKVRKSPHSCERC